MIYTRRPDAYTSFHSDGNTSIGLIKDQQNKIAIMGTSTENRFYINGQEKALGYIGSFRKSPNSPYIANWLEKILEAYKKPGKDLFFCSIISTNKHAIDVFTKKRPYLPPLKLVAKYTIFVVNPKQFKPVKYSQDISFNNLLASEEHLALSFIKTEGQKYDLFPVIDNLQNNFLNIVVKNSYVLKRGAKIVGFACINNQNHKKQFIIKSYSWPLRLFLPLNPFIKAMGLMPLPEINKPIACPAISLCLVENNNKELFNALMEGVAAELKPDYDMFMVALPNNNQNFAALNNWHNFKLENNLYTINFSDKKLYVKQPYTEVSVLL